MKKMFVVFWCIALLLALFILELGKNTLWGWGLTLAFFAAFFAAHKMLLSGLSAPLRLLSWAAFLLLILSANLISSPPVKAIPAVEGEAKPTAVYTVSQGRLTGVFTEDETVEVFCGIPYAAPPVGEYRWKEPRDPEKWDGVRACDTFAPMSMQPRNHPIVDSLVSIFGYHNFSVSLNDNFLPPVSEDSLYLNLWKPAGKTEKLPVLFFIHGGSLTTGQTWHSEYLGESMARRGVIVVNFAYRLGVFGYLGEEELSAESPNGTTGNYGLLDQIKALEWVHHNIASFGGDPENITVCGESAGASSVNALCVSPLTKGLFRRAIAESSGITAVKPYHTFRSLSDALRAGREVKEEFSAGSAEELRAVPAEKLVRTKTKNDSMTVDGYALTEMPYLTYQKGENHEEALLHGFNRHEADLFVLPRKVTAENCAEILSEALGGFAGEATALLEPYPQEEEYKTLIEAGGDAKGSFNYLLSAVWFTYSHYNWSRLLSNEKRPVYEYFFDQNNASLGSFHAGELPYVFGNLFRNASRYTAADFALSETMMSYWENFVKTGDPNGENLPEWKQWEPRKNEVLHLSKTIEMIPDPFAPVYPVIDKHQNSFVTHRENQ